MGVVLLKCAGLRRFEGSPIHAAMFSKYLGLRVFGVADFAGVLRFFLEMARKPMISLKGDLQPALIRFARRLRTSSGDRWKVEREGFPTVPG